MFGKLIPLKFKIPLLIAYTVAVAIVPAIAENKIVKVVKPIVLSKPVENEATQPQVIIHIHNDQNSSGYPESGGRIFRGPVFPLWRPGDSFWCRGPLRRLISRPWR